MDFLICVLNGNRVDDVNIDNNQIFYRQTNLQKNFIESDFVFM